MSIVAKRSPISASAELLESIVVIINFQVYVLYHIMITRFLQLCINVYTFYFQSQFLLQVAADDVAVSTWMLVFVLIAHVVCLYFFVKYGFTAET